ncbi:hypothetical protein JHW43_005253 [Diplocarpon mali]|nr:hypothetical protein JHW43_005253 [Diplocarpon mali]
MAPSATSELLKTETVTAHPYKGGRLAKDYSTRANGSASRDDRKKTEFVLDRHLHRSFPAVERGEGNYLHLTDGRTIFDATSGQMNTGVPYLASTFWGSEIVEELCKELIDGTDRKMARVYLTGSGSEAMESSIKLSRQYFYENDKQTARVNYIAREHSYHDWSPGQRRVGETDVAFVARKAAELEAKFQELGPETIIAFIAEPVVGAGLGCVPSDKDVAPDLQAIGKGLGAGYQPIAAVLISQKVVDALMNGSGQFIHGQTFQGMPVQAAAALEVRKILREQNLMENIRAQGAYLEKRLKALLGDHPNVGDIRGRGLFWGIEFVKDKQTKEPFELHMGIAQKVHDTATSAPFNMTTYPGAGTSDSISGDHVILAPAYNITEEDAEYTARVICDVVQEVFQPSAN